MPDIEQVSPPFNSCIKDLLDAARDTSHLEALLAPGRTSLAYRDLIIQMDDMRQFLNSHGIGINDRVAVVLPNGPEMALAFLGVAAVSACAPLNPAYREHEFDFYLGDINAKALIVASGADSPAVHVARSREIPVIELTPRQGDAAGLFRLEYFGPPGNTLTRGGFAGPDDTALILHTSGTTARPKIVPLLQRNIMRSARNVGHALQLTERDRCLNIMPLFHIHGLIAALLASLNVGGSIVCTSGYSREEFPRILEKFRPTWYTAVPTIHQSIVEYAAAGSIPDQAKSLRLVRSSSSPLPPTVMHDLERIFQVPVIEAYGMTEAAHQIASNPLPPKVRKAGSVGLNAGPEVSVMDEDGSALLSPGETGEIVIRGENVFDGYENNPEANETSFRDGWFRTGDQGYLDEDSYLFITGRLKELINRGGQKISPREIDEVLLSHPMVLQAVAFGCAHRQLGESVCAAVVLIKGGVVSEGELRRHVSECLAPYKVPQQIVFVDEIPKGPTGKIQRIGLAEKLRHLMELPYMPPVTAGQVLAARIWQEVLGVESIGLHNNFFASGGDSLMTIQVLARIQQETGLDLPQDSLFLHPTLAEFSLLVEQRLSDHDELDKLVSGIEALSDSAVREMLES